MRVHSFESLAALDGEGLRYSVFLAGCPLHCACCHNPDTQNPCAGQEYTPAALTAKLLRYKPYFDAGGGGVTFSGGEPLLQAEELTVLGEKLAQERIRYALDTAGSLPLTDAVQRALRGAELVLCDLKFHTEEAYRLHTGGSLQAVLATLQFLTENHIRTWIRTVIIPGINDSEEALDGYLRRLSPFAVEKYELLGFHTMGFYKYGQLGLHNPLQDTPPLAPERLRELQDYIDRKVILCDSESIAP